MWWPPHTGPRRLPRLDRSCLVKVVFYSPSSADSTLHLGVTDSADSTLHLGITDSVDSTLHLSIAYRADSTLHFGISYRIYSYDTAYIADSLDTAYTAYILSNVSGPFGPGCLGIPETSFDPMRSISLF